MRIGVDASGKFLTTSDFRATVVAAAVGTDAAFAEIDVWTNDALDRWGVAHRLSELHAKELRPEEKIEICEMLARRDDVRLAAVVTDPGLLGSADAVARHRQRQRDRAALPRPATDEGRERQQLLLSLLDDPAFRDNEYLLGACLPLALSEAAQRAFAFFQADECRDDMSSFVVRVDEERAPTVSYADASLLPTIGGDERFSFRLPEHWRVEPVHPLFERIQHPDGDGLRPQLLFDDVAWVSSESEPAVQIADVAAWVLARRINEPAEDPPRRCIELLAPLLAGERGRTFELFSIPPIRADQAAMYRHLQQAEQPAWWLV